MDGHLELAMLQVKVSSPGFNAVNWTPSGTCEIGAIYIERHRYY